MVKTGALGSVGDIQMESKLIALLTGSFLLGELWIAISDLQRPDNLG